MMRELHEKTDSGTEHGAGPYPNGGFFFGRKGHTCPIY